MGRADLLDAVVRQASSEGERQVAELLGFVVAETERQGAAEIHEQTDGVRDPSRHHEHMPALDPGSPALFWRALRAEFADDGVETVAEADPGAPGLIQANDLGRRGGSSVEDPPSIVPWSHLRRVMEELLHQPRQIGELDIDAVVHEISRGRPVTRLPRHLRGLRRSRLVVILDRSDRLIPFWRDQFDVFLRLRLEFGDCVSFKWWSMGPPTWSNELEAVAAVSSDLRAGDAVLVLGDLGHYARRGWTRTWAQFGAALRHQGIATAALLPCPAYRWDQEVARNWWMTDWERPVAGVGVRGRGRRGRTDAMLLLTLLSWTARIEPELLREIRLLLPDSDLGTEADAWNREDVTRHSGGLILSDPLRRELHGRLRALMRGTDAERQLLRRTIGVVRRRHAAQPREIWIDEMLQLELLDPSGAWIGPEDLRDAVDFARRLRRSLEKRLNESETPDETAVIDLEGWAERSIRRVCDSAFQHEILGEELLRTYAAVTPRQDKDLRPGVTPAMLSRVEEQHDDDHEWIVRVVGDRLSMAEGAARGSPVATMVGRAKRLYVDSIGYRVEAVERLVPLPNANELQLSLGGQQIMLSREPRPNWARAMGRDRYGLWAEFRVEGVGQRMRWIPPGRFLMGSPPTEVGRSAEEGPQHLVTISQGFWMAETPCTQALWEAVMGHNPSEFKGASRPVEQIAWNDVQRFIARLEECGQSMFHLPSEAQWEYACRAGTTMPTYGELDAIAWYANNSGDKTRDVGLKQPNAWGLFDTLGNVREWCPEALFPYETAVDPVPIDGDHFRVIRGASWADSAHGVRAAVRHGEWQGNGRSNIGFRLARDQETRQ